MRGAPWTYISRCEAALTAYENDGELPPGWSTPRAFSDDEDGLDDEALYSDEAPDPPDTLNVFEFQRYVGKLTEWGSGQLSRNPGVNSGWGLMAEERVTHRTF